jgi:hypothetical protein
MRAEPGEIRPHFDTIKPNSNSLRTPFIGQRRDANNGASKRSRMDMGWTSSAEKPLDTQPTWWDGAKARTPSACGILLVRMGQRRVFVAYGGLLAKHISMAYALAEQGAYCEVSTGLFGARLLRGVLAISDFWKTMENATNRDMKTGRGNFARRCLRFRTCIAYFARTTDLRLLHSQL